MKNPKKLKLRHKKFLSEQGLRSRDFLLISENPDDYVLYHKKTGRILTIRR